MSIETTIKNEPAQCGGCTSSNNNNLPKYDDNTICENCQAQLLKKLELIEQVLNPNVANGLIVNATTLASRIGEAHGMIRMVILELGTAGDQQ